MRTSKSFDNQSHLNRFRHRVNRLFTIRTRYIKQVKTLDKARKLLGPFIAKLDHHLSYHRYFSVDLNILERIEHGTFGGSKTSITRALSFRLKLGHQAFSPAIGFTSQH